MPIPPEAGQDRQGPSGGPEAKQAPLVVAHELAEALTAIANYAEAGVHSPHVPDSPGEAQLRELLRKIDTQVHRANDVLRHLRVLLKREGGEGKSGPEP